MHNIRLRTLCVFPAPAGVILPETKAAQPSSGFPRTCGGDPKAERLYILTAQFSPHLRG